MGIWAYIILGEVGRLSQQKAGEDIEKFICGDLNQEAGFTIRLRLRYETPRAVVWQCRVCFY